MKGIEMVGPEMETEKREPGGLKRKLEGAVLALSIAAVLLVSGAKEVSEARRVITPNPEAAKEPIKSPEQATFRITPEAASFAQKHGLTIVEEVRDPKTQTILEVKDPVTGEDAILIKDCLREDPVTKKFRPTSFYLTGKSRFTVRQADEDIDGDKDTLIVKNTSIDFKNKTVIITILRFVSSDPGDPEADLMIQNIEEVSRPQQ